MGIKGGGMEGVPRDESERGLSHTQCSTSHVPRMPQKIN